MCLDVEKAGPAYFIRHLSTHSGYTVFEQVDNFSNTKLFLVHNNLIEWKKTGLRAQNVQKCLQYVKKYMFKLGCVHLVTYIACLTKKLCKWYMVYNQKCILTGLH